MQALSPLQVYRNHSCWQKWMVVPSSHLVTSVASLRHLCVCVCLLAGVVLLIGLTLFVLFPKSSHLVERDLSLVPVPVGSEFPGPYPERSRVGFWFLFILCWSERTRVCSVLHLDPVALILKWQLKFSCLIFQVGTSMMPCSGVPGEEVSAYHLTQPPGIGLWLCGAYRRPPPLPRFTFLCSARMKGPWLCVYFFPQRLVVWLWDHLCFQLNSTDHAPSLFVHYSLQCSWESWMHRQLVCHLGAWPHQGHLEALKGLALCQGQPGISLASSLISLPPFSSCGGGVLLSERCGEDLAG